MKIQRLTLQNFRNFEEETFLFSDGINILAGYNAQGKTNCIEAVYFCTCLKSERVLREEQLIRTGQEEAKITLDFDREGQQEQLVIILHRAGPKEFRYNGLVVPRLRDLLGCFQSVLFTPDHLDLIKEGPHKRRGFLDMALCSLDVCYTDQLLQYQKILKNRNALLRQCQLYPERAEMLEIWDQKLAESGAYLAKTRQDYTESLSQSAKEYYQQISKQEEKLKIIYLNQLTKNHFSEEEYIRLFIKRLQKTRAGDITMGQTMSGVHKDDLLILSGGKTMKYFASQGQIRSAILALKLAEADGVFDRKKSYPVLLLDDILSELDFKRQQFIFQKMEGYQTILSTCELSKVRKKGDQTFFIKNGKVARIRVSSSGAGRSD